MPPSEAPANRLLSLDVMRGATIVGMILVNNPGNWGALYWPLGHADWHGWTPTDLIFPFFLFMVGVAMAYSFAKYTAGEGRATPAVWARIARRVVTLILLGLLLSGCGKLFDFLLGHADTIDLSTLRFPGVLQRIALAYLGASIVVLGLAPRGRVVAAVGLLAGYAIALEFLPAAVPAEERLSQQENLVREVDLSLFGADHLWTRARSRPTDPEGLLSTLPSIVSVLIGYAVGSRIKRRGLSANLLGTMLAVGATLTAAGLAWDRGPEPGWGMPINKALWTPSFVLLTGGLATLGLAACLLVFDFLGRGSKTVARVAEAFQLVGVNAIFAFVASGLVARLMISLRVGETSLQWWLYQNLIVGPLQAIGLADPKLASFAYAVVFVACWWLVLWAMWRRGWAIRV